MSLRFDRRDSRGIAQILKSREVASVIHGLAAEVAGNITVAAPVVVDDYTTDRAASSVTILDHRGRIWQVRDGVLTRAATQAGLEVRAK